MWVRVRDFFVQAEDGIRGLVRSRGIGNVYKEQENKNGEARHGGQRGATGGNGARPEQGRSQSLSPIHL